MKKLSTIIFIFIALNIPSLSSCTQASDDNVSNILANAKKKAE